MSNNDRIRRVDVESLSVERVEEMSVQIGEKVSEILNKAAVDINTILNIYGLQAKVVYQIEPLNQDQTNKE